MGDGNGLGRMVPRERDHIFCYFRFLYIGDAPAQEQGGAAPVLASEKR